MRTRARDTKQAGAVSALMHVWQGMTPDGYTLVVDREDGGRWVVTVASVSRSRNESLEAALVEAGGGSVPRAWAEQAAKVICAYAAAGDAISVPAANGSRTGAA